jgi:hypothetical protein
LETYAVAFGLLILQGFHIKQEELIGQKLILILQGIKLLFSKDSLTVISIGYFSLSYLFILDYYFIYFIISKPYFNYFGLYLNMVHA